MTEEISLERTKELLRQIEKDTTLYYDCRGCGASTNAKVGSDRGLKRLCVTCYVTAPSYRGAPQSNESHCVEPEGKT